jgi:chromosome segregation ATPase
MILTLTKQTVGDLQERLIQTEAAHAVSVFLPSFESQLMLAQEKLASAHAQNMVLSDQKTTLVSSLKTAESEIEHLKASIGSNKTEYEAHLKELTDSYAAKLQGGDHQVHKASEENRLLQEALTESKVSIGRMQSQFEAELQKKQEKETELMLVQAEKETQLLEEIKQLKDTVGHGQKELKRVEDRAEKIDERYKRGDIVSNSLIRGYI